METQTTKSATVHYGKRFAMVLCPNGHVVSAIDMDWTFLGSRAATELAAHGARQGNMYDRLAAGCAVRDAETK